MMDLKLPEEEAGISRREAIKSFGILLLGSFLSQVASCSIEIGSPKEYPGNMYAFKRRDLDRLFSGEFWQDYTLRLSDPAKRFLYDASREMENDDALVLCDLDFENPVYIYKARNNSLTRYGNFPDEDLKVLASYHLSWIDPTPPNCSLDADIIKEYLEDRNF